MQRTDLSRFNNSWFNPGAPLWKWAAWHIVNTLFFRNSLSVWNGGKRFLLRVFGARLGKHVILKPGINIKYPWHLVVGDNAWIGEGVWIENHVLVSVGDNACLSQGAFLTTGNHDYTLSTFDLIVKEIILEEGVWIGAGAIVCPGVHAKSHAVLSAGSVATGNLEAYTIYQGNPAQAVRTRVMKG